MKNKILTKKEQAELLGGMFISSVAIASARSNINNAPACMCQYKNKPTVRNKNSMDTTCCVCI